MGLKIDFDEFTTTFIARILTSEDAWQMHMHLLATNMGADAREYIKPFVTAKSVWHGTTHGTGAMANSVKEDVTMLGNGFWVNFDGNFYGNYLDTGNFPPGSEIARTSGKKFPVGLRAGQEYADLMFKQYIHGVGNYNPSDWPAGFSVKTAQWLATDANMQKYCDEFMGPFLKELVTI
jgi:hypothetical protein